MRPASCSLVPVTRSPRWLQKISKGQCRGGSGAVGVGGLWSWVTWGWSWECRLLWSSPSSSNSEGEDTRGAQHEPSARRKRGWIPCLFMKNPCRSSFGRPRDTPAHLTDQQVSHDMSYNLRRWSSRPGSPPTPCKEDSAFTDAAWDTQPHCTLFPIHGPGTRKSSRLLISKVAPRAEGWPGNTGQDEARGRTARPQEEEGPRTAEEPKAYLG